MWLVDLPSRPESIGVEVGRVLAPEVHPDNPVVVVGLWWLELELGLAEAGIASNSIDRVPIRVRTLPRSQAEHPKWLDRRALRSPALNSDARAMAGVCVTEGCRIWLLRSPSVTLESKVFSVFTAWRRTRVVDSRLIVVDLMVPPGG